MRVKTPEIFNEALAAGLRVKLNFSQSELDEFRVRDLKSDSFIKVDEEYFAPAVLQDEPASVPRIPSIAPASYGNWREIEHGNQIDRRSWQPEDAEKLGEAYYFHEPGERVRTNLLLLDEWRRMGRFRR